MKTQKESTIPPCSQQKKTSQFKEHALELADWDGILTVAQDLVSRNQCYIHGDQNSVKWISHSKNKSFSKLKWHASNEKIRALKRKWLCSKKRRRTLQSRPSYLRHN